MTRDEMDRIDRLAEKVESYHTEIREQIAACKACRADLVGVQRVLYGNGEPGLKGDVQSLKESRTHMRAGLAALWSAAVAIGAAVVKLFVG